MMETMMHTLARSPYRFLIVAAVLAAILCLMPIQVDAPEQGAPIQASQQQEMRISGVPAGADLSERTQQNAYLHRVMTYAPCGHSVQRREALPAALVGLSRAALEAQMGDVLPGAAITGFSAQEVDIALQLSIPCPLHWVLIAGEDGRLEVLQNLTGEALDVVRKTDIEQALLSEQTRLQLLEGVVFDDVQALEGYLESLSS